MLPKSGHLPHVFPDPKRKRIAIYSQVEGRLPDRLEIWAYGGLAPERKMSITLKHDAHVLAFADAEDTLAVGDLYENWSLVKLEADKASISPGGKLPSSFLTFLQFRNGDRELLALSKESLGIFEIASKPTLKTSADLKHLAGADHNVGSKWAFSADGRWLASEGEFGELRVWDAEQLPPKMVTSAPPLALEVLGIPNAGTRVLTTEFAFPYGNTFREWDMVGQAPQASDAAKAAPFKAIAPDGTLLADFARNAVVVKQRNGKGATREGSFPKDYQAGFAANACFSPGGRWLFTALTPQGNLWDTQAEHLEPLVIKDLDIKPSAWSRDDRYILVQEYPMMVRYDLSAFPKTTALELFKREEIHCTHYMASSKGSLALIDRAWGQEPVDCFIIPADKKLGPLATSDAGKITNPGVVSLKLDARVKLQCAAFTPDNRHVARADYSGRLAIFDTRTGEIVKRFAPWGKITRVHFADDGRHLIVGNADHTIFVLRLELPQ